METIFFNKFLTIATEIWRQKIIEVAKNKENQDVQFAIAAEDSFKDDLKLLQLDDSGEELNVGLWDADGKRYRMEPEEDFDSEVLQEFLDAWKNSKLCLYVLWMKWDLLYQKVPKRGRGPNKITQLKMRLFENGEIL